MRRKLSNLSTYCLHCPLTPAWPRSCPELDKEAAVVGLHQLQLAQLGGHQQTMERTISRSAHTIKVGTAAQLHSSAANRSMGSTTGCTITEKIIIRDGLLYNTMLTKPVPYDFCVADPI